MPVQIQLRHDTAANWTAVDPTLATGEVGVETDTQLAKIGDGSTAWTSLAYPTPAEVADARGGDATLGDRLDAISTFPGGSSFPGSPTDGDLWYRTDRHKSYFWDAAETGSWLSLARVIVPLSIVGGTTTDYTLMIAPLPSEGQSVGLHFDRADFLTRVDTTNDGSNYWTVAVTADHGANIWDASIASINTSADSLTTWTPHASAVNAPVSTTAAVLVLLASKTGSPGALYLGVRLYAREIG